MARPLSKSRQVLANGLGAIRPAILSAIFFSFFINLLVFVSPLYMLQIYDRVLASRNETTLVVLTIIAAFLLFIYAILETLRSRILVRAGILFDERIATPIFDAIHRANLRNPGGGHHQGLRDIDSVREFLTGAGLIALCDLPWVPIFVFACFLLHPWFGYIAIVGAVGILALTLINEKTTSNILGMASTSAIQANNQAQSVLRNGEVLHAMGMLEALRSLWVTRHQSTLSWQAMASDRAGLLVAFTKFFRMFLQTAILGVGAYLAIHGVVSAGAMIAASIIIGRALAPIELVVGNWKGLVNARGAKARLEKLLDIAGAEEDRIPLPRPEGRLEVENLVAGAPGGNKPILKGLTFAIEPGETLCVVGPSAAGKSSLVRVLTGIWPKANGTVRLDGAELSHWDPQALGQFVGYLPQDVELFAGSVAENISRFRDVEADEIIAVAKLAGCHDLIQGLAEGYNTQIGEGGAALSGGQRQRIALARALFGNPALVILDEPNSNLDSAGEEALLRAIQELKARGTTVILVTHKVNILTAADKVLVLTQGALQAFGPREKVLGKVMGPQPVAIAG
ncbi:type I secretion system permease/ATPase [Rhabdaerophilum sp. SD176]|uniref:type I secretion system permease/ATPase n=1 Tax=Rhabdaerophilum sp. SD176 TaxID=2983548 RepID=UPI0024DF31F2|nr:type I secretion system permease/ATPase [Rhabdaerophilum sp. SD176]